jgi:outer membrane protein OmpA-like peptidoglycan-associated protein
MKIAVYSLLGALAVWSSPVWAQSNETPASDLVPRNIKAIGYQVGGGSATVDLVPSGDVSASGEAKVQAKPAITTVEAEVRGLRPPTQIGAEFLTYVMWAVSPDGRADNLGELIPDNSGKAKLKATTQLQSFSLFVTAEPYSVVRHPSEVLILENALRKNTKGRIFPVEGYKLMRRTQYEKLGNPLALSMDLKKVPLQMYEARNAVDIAKSRASDKYAPEIFGKAESSLKMAENALAAKKNTKDVMSLARQTAQFAEDARALSMQRQAEERIAQEKEAAAAKAKAEAEAKAAAEAAEAKRRADEDAKRQAELAAAREAQLKAEADAKEARLKAEADAQQARMKAEADAKEARMKAEADAKEARMKADADLAAAKAKADADALQAREDAAKAEADRARQAAEALRAQLLEQFNRILETKDTVRGLVITMGDVLFDTGKYDLRSPTREMLAKLSGIVLAHPGLRLEVEGHTDSVGSDEFNQTLSEKRADTVREYLIKQGLDGSAVTAKGFGKTMPVADNTSAAGRQKNRRVELIVSGEVIGVKIGS